MREWGDGGWHPSSQFRYPAVGLNSSCSRMFRSFLQLTSIVRSGRFIVLEFFFVARRRGVSHTAAMAQGWPGWLQPDSYDLSRIWSARGQQGAPGKVGNGD